MQCNYDAIVLGAGALGSAAAYYLAKQGHRVLLLEQFELNHQKGSSYGASRIIRYAYDLPIYTELMKSAYALWAEIEAESGEKLYTRTGGIDFGKPTELLFQAIKTSLHSAGIPFEIMPATEAQHRFPQFRFREDWEVIYQSDAGILAASASVLAHLKLAEKLGAEIRPQTPILDVHPFAEYVQVVTNEETFSASHLVIAAGGWMRSVLQKLDLDVPLRPMRCQESYYETNVSETFEQDSFPTFIAHVKDEFGYMPYGMAGMDGSGLKIGLHGGEMVDHPSQIDYSVDEATVQKVLRFAGEVLPDVVRLKSARICLYTMTPDEHFLIDKHPAYPHIVFAGGCSGHAFKFSTLIGKIASDLVLTGETSHDISLFSVQRFL
jgi:monomeric sarcosine oxidase